MTTTVTTVTVTTVTVMGVAGALSLMVTVALIALLMSKELATAAESGGAVRWGRVLNVGIVPLLLSFVAIVGVRIADSM